MKCENCDFTSKFLRDFDTCKYCEQEICKECKEDHYEMCRKPDYSYPEAFDDFENSKIPSIAEIRFCLEDAKKTLQESSEKFELYYTNAGKVLVVGVKHEDGECAFFVAESFKELNVEFDELSKITF